MRSPAIGRGDAPWVLHRLLEYVDGEMLPTMYRQIFDHLVLALRDAYVASVSPILKPPEALAQGSLLDLDMIEEAQILIDRDGLFQRHLDALAARLRAMGARIVRKGGGYYWELKPDYRWGIASRYDHRRIGVQLFSARTQTLAGATDAVQSEAYPKCGARGTGARGTRAQRDVALGGRVSAAMA